LLPLYPASYDLPNIISVGATDENDDRYYDASNLQNVNGSNYGSINVDIAAPGVDVLSTIPYAGNPSELSRYGVLTGTSMAAPHVAGVAALGFSLLPLNASYSTVKDAILSNADANSDFSGISTTGGRLNAARAISALSGAVLVVLGNENTGIIDDDILV